MTNWQNSVSAMANDKTLKLAFIAGERSGDLLGAGLIAAIRRKHAGQIELIGIGGDAMAEQGLESLFDYQELSLMGFGAVIARLPQLLMRIRETARTIIAAKPDCLVIIDSPDFTHRVARRVRAALPDVPIIDYVCPTVWAWKPERATKMTAYIDHVLSIFPFEPQIVTSLGGPPVTYVGHRLMSDEGLQTAAQTQSVKQQSMQALKPGQMPDPACCLLLPGSRSIELKLLLPAFRDTVAELRERKPELRFVVPTLPRLEAPIREATDQWNAPVEVVTGEAAKWQAFGQADAALAASGTVLLELALAGVPCISIYKLDPISKLMMYRVTAWTAALPNFIADYPVINEYINEFVRPGLLARRLLNLMSNSPERLTMIETFDQVRAAMETDVPASDLAADTVLSELRKP